MPLTVSTRLGIKSARRCRTTSTCDHADLTASFLLTSELRTLIYLPNDSSAINSNVIITIRLLLMDSLPQKIVTDDRANRPFYPLLWSPSQWRLDIGQRLLQRGTACGQLS